MAERGRERGGGKRERGERKQGGHGTKELAEATEGGIKLGWGDMVT